MRLAALIVTSLWIAVGAAGQSVPEDELKDFMVTTQRAVEKRKAALEDEVRLAEKGRVSRFLDRGHVVQDLPRGRKRYVFASPDDKAQVLDSLKSAIYRARNPDPLTFLPTFDLSGNYPKGHVGTLPDRPVSYRVLSVVDETNVLVDVFVAKSLAAGRRSNAAIEAGTRKAYQARRAQTPDLTVDTYSHTLWLQIDTDGLHDEQQVDFEDRLFLSVGPKRYDTGPGETATVPLLKEIDVPRIPDKPPPTAVRTPGQSPR